MLYDVIWCYMTLYDVIDMYHTLWLFLHFFEHQLRHRPVDLGHPPQETWSMECKRIWRTEGTGDGHRGSWRDSTVAVSWMIGRWLDSYPMIGLKNHPRLLGISQPAAWLCLKMSYKNICEPFITMAVSWGKRISAFRLSYCGTKSHYVPIYTSNKPRTYSPKVAAERLSCNFLPMPILKPYGCESTLLTYPFILD